MNNYKFFQREIKKDRWEKQKADEARRLEDWHNGVVPDVGDAWVEAEMAKNIANKQTNGGVEDTSIPF